MANSQPISIALRQGVTCRTAAGTHRPAWSCQKSLISMSWPTLKDMPHKKPIPLVEALCRAALISSSPVEPLTSRGQER